jgi:hypothetical protein
MAFDSGLNRSVLFAGNSVPSFLNDTWTFDGTDWTQMVLPASPSTRMRPALAFDGSRGRTVMFGGYSDNGFESDTWEMDSGGGSGPHMYPAGATMFGVGCGSQALTVSPTQGSRPLLGQSQLTDVTNIPTFYAAMALGFSSTSIGSLTLPLALDLFGMPGCYLYHDISIDLAEFCSPTGSGQGRHTLPIPANNALLGVVLYLQAWSGTNQNAGGLVTSNAIELTIGNQ